MNSEKSFAELPVITVGPDATQESVVPVVAEKKFLLKVNGSHEITDAQRSRLERKWLLEKLFIGTN